MEYDGHSSSSRGIRLICGVNAIYLSAQNDVLLRSKASPRRSRYLQKIWRFNFTQAMEIQGRHPQRRQRRLDGVVSQTCRGEIKRLIPRRESMDFWCDSSIFNNVKCILFLVRVQCSPSDTVCSPVSDAGELSFQHVEIRLARLEDPFLDDSHIHIIPFNVLHYFRKRFLL